MLGCSPTLIRALIPHGDPKADLSSLRTIVTTGEPWNPDPYRWLFERVGGGRCPIVNITGGTEVGAFFLGSSPAEPIKAARVGGPTPGMAMDVVDAEGRSLVGTGEVGELVCRKPFPGMTRGFWRDPERYLETYWRRFPGVWTHGDWASVDEDGYWFLHGRSDDTLNIAGKRIGPAELESAAVAHPAVAEAAAVGVPHEVKGEVAWVFCVLAPGASAQEEDVRALVADELGKAFAPERVVFVSALPKTRSAKIVRRAVRATVLGQDPGDMSSVENPDALEEHRLGRQVSFRLRGENSMRIALAQINTTVGDLDGNRALIVSRLERGARRRRGPRPLPRARSDLLPARGSAPAARLRARGEAVARGDRGRDDRNLGARRGAVVRRRPLQRVCDLRRRRGEGGLPEALPAELRGVRRGALLRRRARPRAPAARRGTRRRDDLRGHVAARPAGDRPGARRRAAARQRLGLAVPRRQGAGARGDVPAARAGHVQLRRLRQRGRRPGRARLRRPLVRPRRRGRGARPGAWIRGGAARRRRRPDRGDRAAAVGDAPAGAGARAGPAADRRRGRLNGARHC